MLENNKRLTGRVSRLTSLRFMFSIVVRADCNVSAIMKIDMTSFFCHGWSDLDEISQTGAHWHANCGDMVEIKTESRSPIWPTVVFLTQVISHPWMKFSLQIDDDLRKRLTSSNTKAKVLLRKYYYAAILNIIEVIPLPRVVRFGWNLVVWCRIAGRFLWLKSQPERFRYGGRGRLFVQNGSSYISSTKFGLWIDYDLRMRVTSSNTKPEVVLTHPCVRWCLAGVWPTEISADLREAWRYKWPRLLFFAAAAIFKLLALALA